MSFARQVRGQTQSTISITSMYTETFRILFMFLTFA
jgi:hypothetical protein